MTADMAFECVLVSRDPGVVCVLNRVLDKFSIATNVCFTSEKASDHLAQACADLIIVDYDDTTDDFLRDVHKIERRQKPTVMAVSESDRLIPGTHLTMRKPLTGESCAQTLKTAYILMLRDHRRYARHALMAALTARDQNGLSISLTVTDIGDGGVGLMTKEPVVVGSILSAHLPLPGAERPIYIEARVLWTRQYGAAGCEFVRIPPVDLSILHDWLKAKCQVKQPLVEL